MIAVYKQYIRALATLYQFEFTIKTAMLLLLARLAVLPVCLTACCLHRAVFR